MIIDIHNHFYAPNLLGAIESQHFSKDLRVERDSWNRKIIVQKGTRVVTITEPMSNVDMRLKDMEDAGVDMQALSLSVNYSTLSLPVISTTLTGCASLNSLSETSSTMFLTSWSKVNM